MIKAFFRKLWHDFKDMFHFRPLHFIGWLLVWGVPLGYVAYVAYQPHDAWSWLSTGGMILVILFILIYFLKFKSFAKRKIAEEKTVERVSFAKMNLFRLSILNIFDTLIKIGTIVLAYLGFKWIISASALALALLEVLFWAEIIGHGFYLFDFMFHIGREQLDLEALTPTPTPAPAPQNRQNP